MYKSYSTAVMAPLVAGSVVATILPLLAVTVLAYCITGYIRDALFGRVVKKCIGPLCNILVSSLYDMSSACTSSCVRICQPNFTVCQLSKMFTLELRY